MPLHLAVKNVNTSDTSRLVRTLLIRGARKDLKDIRGRLPIDLVADIKKPDLAQDVQSILVSYWIITIIFNLILEKAKKLGVPYAQNTSSKT